MALFELHAPYQPKGDQPQAIKGLFDGIKKGYDFQTLLGVTGSGKTFTMANIIEKTQKPTLIIAHNKTLAAQLAQEFKEFFPNNAVHYFVSYYDYYQPEAFVVKTGSYIEKEATINEEIDRLRHAATESLLTRKDVIIVASVSCIYGIGEAEQYLDQSLQFKVGHQYVLETLIADLVTVQFVRSKAEWKPWMFLVKWDIIDIWPSSSETIVRLEFFGDELEKITRIEPLSHRYVESLSDIAIFPAKHFVAQKWIIEAIIPKIKDELHQQIQFFEQQEKRVEAERIKMRVEYDMEMLQETGYVNGIENYSMYISGRMPWESPATLIDFFPEWFLTFIDESHITIPQIWGMYAGDRARKENLVNYGFRLPTALENRPLRLEEFEKKIGQTIFVSATPSKYESSKERAIIEQVIRPTWLLDPHIAIEDMEYMVDSLMRHITLATKRNERSLITTITKKSSEDLAAYLAENGIKVRYLHSEIDTIERLELIKDFRKGTIDVIVWVNLLREWLDLPETSFIGILDAEKIGFLRSKTSLLQIIGRAARNTNGHVIMYSHDKKISSAMQEAIDETDRRRSLQQEHNRINSITPKTVISRIKDIGISQKTSSSKWHDGYDGENVTIRLKRLQLEMDLASANLDFERAAELRDMIVEVKRK